VRSSPVRLQYGLQGARQGWQVAVVHPPVVQLAGEVAEQPGPVAAGGHERHLDFDAPLDELHCRQTGGSGPGLFPSPVPASGRAPLRDWPPAGRSDGSTAPAAGPRCDPPFGTVRVRCGLIRAGPRGRPLVLTPLPLALPSPGSVLRTPTGSHAVKTPDESPETRHHELRDRQGMDAPLDLDGSPVTWRCQRRFKVDSLDGRVSTACRITPGRRGVCEWDGGDASAWTSPGKDG
jgi:hypothetical protein